MTSMEKPLGVSTCLAMEDDASGPEGDDGRIYVLSTEAWFRADSDLASFMLLASVFGECHPFHV